MRGTCFKTFFSVLIPLYFTFIHQYFQNTANALYFEVSNSLGSNKFVRDRKFEREKECFKAEKMVHEYNVSKLINRVCNLLNLLFFLFSSIKHGFRHRFRARCSKLTIKTPEYVTLTIKLIIKTTSRRSGLFIVNFEHVPLLLTVFLLLTLIS